MSEHNEKAVVGTGYVGMSMAELLAQHNEVTALDIDASRVDLINQGKSTVMDAEIEHYLAEKHLSLTATLDKTEAYRDPAFVVVATPTDYDPETNYFDTSSVEAVIDDVLTHNEMAMIVYQVDRASRLHAVYERQVQNRADYFLTGIFARGSGAER